MQTSCALDWSLGPYAPVFFPIGCMKFSAPMLCMLDSEMLKLRSWIIVRDSAIQVLWLSILVAEHPFPPFLNFGNRSKNASTIFCELRNAYLLLVELWKWKFDSAFDSTVFWEWVCLLLFWPLNCYNNANDDFFLHVHFSVSRPKYATEVILFLSAAWILSHEWNMLAKTY